MSDKTGDNTGNKKRYYPRKKKDNNVVVEQITFIDTIQQSPKKTVENEESQNLTKEQFKIDYSKPIDEIDFPIKSLSDLVEVGKLYLSKDFASKNYSINVKGIYEMTESLLELISTVGLESVKTDILEYILFFSQDLHNVKKIQAPKRENKRQENPSVIFQLFNPGTSSSHTPDYTYVSKDDKLIEDDCLYDLTHIVITGPPGCGKTLLARILAKISLHLGIATNDKFIVAKRSDLVGEYLGVTAIKTQKLIDKALGGTLLIDEAYSLGNTDKDVYSKECIDTLNQNLTEKKGQFQCIIVGYEEELEKNFFSMNPGLKRRFPFKYNIEKYTSLELLEIFLLKVDKIKYKIKKPTVVWLKSTNYFQTKMDNFKAFGGDIETFLFNVKIEHGKRVFGKHPALHKILNKEDIECGYERYLKHKTKVKDYNQFLYL